MSEMTQCYKVEVDHPEKCRPAQFVFEDNDSDDIIGFVSNVDGKHATFCTFAPIVLPECGINIKETLDHYGIRLLLHNALEQNPEMEEEWLEVLQEYER